LAIWPISNIISKVKEINSSKLSSRLDRIAAAGMAVELNTGGLRKPVAEIYPSPLLLSLIRERDIRICFGSDAHEPGQVGMDFDKALMLAREIGYTEFVRFRNRKMISTPLP
jgi:histidinol-phosphatase (PHP family)